MSLKSLLIFCAFAASASAKILKIHDGSTFKNVVVQGYSMYTYKFNYTIVNSNNLKENLPERKVFDALKIEDNTIPVLYPNSVADFENLDELILNHDEIENIRPGAFKNVPQLRKLVITNNKLEEIKEGVFNGLNIGTLDLSKNRINSIAPKAFNDMPELLNINLADNMIRVWNRNWFENTPLLTRVSLQNNLIEEIPAEAFKNFEGEKQFGEVPLTINIILSHNKIKNIDKNAFKGLKKINNLWLDSNEIEELDNNLLTGVAISDLRIDHNKFECIEGDLKNIFVADTTHIDGNPWDCGCLKNIEQWVSQNGKSVVMYYSKMDCETQRLRIKLDDLKKKLQEENKNALE